MADPAAHRGKFPGTYRMSKNRWGMKVWIAGELHYLGCLEDRRAATEYVQLVESRYPDRTRRPHGTLFFDRRRRRWIARMPRPAREVIGQFDTRWAGERAMRQLGLR
jgi:hypothetical protein